MTAYNKRLGSLWTTTFKLLSYYANWLRRSFSHGPFGQLFKFVHIDLFLCLSFWIQCLCIELVDELTLINQEIA